MIEMEAIFLDVGYGDAVIFHDNGHYGIIDGGSALAAEYENFPHRMPIGDFLAAHDIVQVDFIMLTHIHEDHICGIEKVMDRLEIGCLVVPYLPDVEGKDDICLDTKLTNLALYTQALNAYKHILSMAKRRNISIHVANAGMKEDLLGMSVSILAPIQQDAHEYQERLERVFGIRDKNVLEKQIVALDRDSNRMSLVADFEYEDINMVLAADNVPSNWSEDIFSFIQNGNVLKLPHHGQPDAVDTRLLEAISNTMIITCSSSDRRNNSANRKVYEQLAQKDGMDFLFTDEVEYLPFFKRENRDFNSFSLFVADNEIKVIL
jgi:competence protein ComEC